MRLRKRQWSEEFLTSLKNIVLTEEMEQYKGRWQEFFPSQADLPLHLEIGTGKGRFISEMAQLYLGKVNFIGLEAKGDVLFQAAAKIRAQNLPNVKLLAQNAFILPDLFAPGEVERIYLNFCDPWPKTRHAKRRLTHRGFLAKYRTVMGCGGEIFFKTDNEELFEFSLNEFAAFGAELKNISLDLYRQNGISSYAANVPTEYETKFKERGFKIYRAEVVFIK